MSGHLRVSRLFDMKNPKHVQLQLERQGADKVSYGLRETVDVSPIIRNAEMYRRLDREQGVSRGSELRRVASLDFNTVRNIKAKYGIDATNIRDQSESKLLMSIIESEYPKMKTTEARITPRLRG